MALATLALSAGCSPDVAVKDDATGWGKEVAIDAPEAEGERPQVVIDADGNAIAIWPAGTSDAGFKLASSRYTHGLGWSTAQLLDDVKGQPDIAMGPKGNAIVTWSNGSSHVFAAEYEPGAGWSDAVRLDGDCPEGPCNSMISQVALDREGRGLAIWATVDEVYTAIWASRYLPGSGWGVAEQLATAEGFAPGWPQIGLDAGGRGVAVWGFEADVGSTVWSSRYSPAEGWGDPQLIATSDEEVKALQLAVDALGNTFVVWNLWVAERELWVNRFDAAAGWGEAEVVAEGIVFTPYTPAAGLGVDDAGNAALLWQSQTGRIATSRYTPGAGWGASEEIGAGLPNEEPIGVIIEPANPHVAMAANGDAVAVWRQEDSEVISVFASRFSPDSGWQPAEVIEHHHISFPMFPIAAINEGGAAVAVWQRIERDFGNDTSIWANVLRP